jgi:hypothetical protein
MLNEHFDPRIQAANIPYIALKSDWYNKLAARWTDRLNDIF